MPRLQAMWIHGNVAVPERTVENPGPLVDVPGVPWSRVVGFPQGPGKTFRGSDNANNWFHLPIPTPVIHEGSRARIKKVFLLFRSDPGVAVTAIHVWDGAQRRLFASSMPAGVSGRHDGTGGGADLQENITAWTIGGTPEVLWGIGLSVLVAFTDPGNITFCSAGADFDVGL